MAVNLLPLAVVPDGPAMGFVGGVGVALVHRRPLESGQKLGRKGAACRDRTPGFRPGRYAFEEASRLRCLVRPHVLTAEAIGETGERGIAMVQRLPLP